MLVKYRPSKQGGLTISGKFQLVWREDFEAETGKPGGEGEKTLSVGLLRSDLQRGDRLGQGPGPQKRMSLGKWHRVTGHSMVYKPHVEETRPFHWSHDSGSVRTQIN